ncbi:DUF998 domain-containing protein [Prauserella halophila]|uniref:DUF998 domain-containing protein n=1 Tax=Prauserella halophila TaxID=185641 RepID=A0ABN1WC01_9PSEU|nr:DUF998 domain-containing protein [Prauserella halophila]
MSALAVGAALLVGLHLVPPTSEIDPLRRTISEYALGPHKWIFDLSVLLTAAGSGVTFAGIARRGAHRAAVVLGALWTVSLLIIVVFPKIDWSAGPTVGGRIHFYASVVAFVSLPFAVLLCARVVFPGSAARRRLARGLAVTSLCWFAVVLGTVGITSANEASWWQVLPVGLIERLIVGSAHAAHAVLLVGLARDQRDNRAPARHPGTINGN